MWHLNEQTSTKMFVDLPCLAIQPSPHLENWPKKKYKEKIFNRFLSAKSVNAYELQSATTTIFNRGCGYKEEKTAHTTTSVYHQRLSFIISFLNNNNIYYLQCRIWFLLDKKNIYISLLKIEWMNE